MPSKPASEPKAFRESTADTRHGVVTAASPGGAKLSGRPPWSVRWGGKDRDDFTMTRKLHVDTAPQALVAVQVTTLVPSGNALPEGGVQITGPTLPEADGW